MELEKNTLPLKTAMFNKAFGVFVHGRKGILNAEELKDAAIKKTGISDFGDPYYEEGLNRLIEYGNNNTNLNNLGRFLLKSALIHNLSNRLLLGHELNTNKHLGNMDMLPPIIVTGLPRSGTTLLHRLLIRDENNYGTPLWEMLRPLNEPGRKDRRKLKARLEMKASNFIKGNINHIHYTTYREPEECVYLFGATFNAMLYWIQFPLYPYVDWFVQQNRDKKYLDYFHYLKILQAVHPDRRLVMKSPEHLGSIAELKKNIPEAIIIETHRKPLECFNSMNSMLYTLHKSVTCFSDKKSLAGTNMNLLENELRRNREARISMDLDIIDVWYDDLVSDPLAIVASVYKQTGMKISDTFYLSMEKYAGNNPRHKHGVHRYDSQDFGLKDGEIADRLDQYHISR